MKYTASISVTIPPFPFDIRSRVLNGTKALMWDGSVITFHYHGHVVEMKPDDKFATLTDKDGAAEKVDFPRMCKSWSSRISFMKRYVLQIERDERRQRERDLEREVMSKVDYVRGASDPTYSYHDYHIEIHPDLYGAGCPWDDWDAEPSALRFSPYTWKHAYGKSDIGSFVSPVTSDWWNAEDVVIRQIGVFHQGVAMDFSTREESYIAYFTREDIDEHFGGDDDLAHSALHGSINTFKEWADVGPHGFVLNRDGEVIDSLWDIYSGDPYGSPYYAISEAIAIADSDMKERDELEDEAREEKLTELGYI